MWWRHYLLENRNDSLYVSCLYVCQNNAYNILYVSMQTINFFFLFIQDPKYNTEKRIGRRDRERMVVGFTTTYAISAIQQWCYEFESRSGRDVQHYVIQFVNDLWQVGGFLLVLLAESGVKHNQTNKQTHLEQNVTVHITKYRWRLECFSTHLLTVYLCLSPC